MVLMMAVMLAVYLDGHSHLLLVRRGGMMMMVVRAGSDLPGSW
jgi:hypothetical protein